MVLGLYYITKTRPGAKGEGITFYSEEVLIAYNEGKVSLHTQIKVKTDDLVEDKKVNHISKLQLVG